MDRGRVIIFLGVWKGVTVYITQRILLKSRPPSVLNSGLISSLPSCRYAWRPLNGHSGCYGRPGLSYLLLPVGILLRRLRLRRTQCLCSPENMHTQTHTHQQHTAEKSHSKSTWTQAVRTHAQMATRIVCFYTENNRHTHTMSNKLCLKMCR